MSLLSKWDIFVPPSSPNQKAQQHLLQLDLICFKYNNTKNICNWKSETLKLVDGDFFRLIEIFDLLKVFLEVFSRNKQTWLIWKLKILEKSWKYWFCIQFDYWSLKIEWKFKNWKKETVFSSIILVSRNKILQKCEGWFLKDVISC